jgi:hypothetical protein
MASASDVPGKYDVVINGEGFCLLDSIEPSLPFRTQRAIYSMSPTFVSRQNVQGNYGDNQQDFWLTASQHDWSLGEDQKYFRAAEDSSVRKFWKGYQVDAQIAGQVVIGPSTKIVSTASAAVSSCWAATPGSFFLGASTNLHEVSATGTATDRGAHGAGGSATAVCSDGGVKVYVSGSAATKIRAYDTAAHTFADFSATPAESLAFLNNTLYGYKAGVLSRYDTAGLATTLNTWKDAAGTTIAGTGQLAVLGSKLLILRTSLTSKGGPELWIYDGTGTSKAAEFPPNFTASSIAVSEGITYIIGTGTKRGSGSRTEVYYWANGTIGLAFSSDHYTSSTIGGSAVCAFSDGVFFTDGVDATVRFFSLTSGGIFTMGNYTPSANAAQFAAGSNVAILTQGSTSNTFLFNP